MKVKELIAKLEKIEDKEKEVTIYCMTDEVMIAINGTELRKNEDGVETFCLIEEI